MLTSYQKLLIFVHANIEQAKLLEIMQLCVKLKISFVIEQRLQLTLKLKHLQRICMLMKLRFAVY